MVTKTSVLPVVLLIVLLVVVGIVAFVLFSASSKNVQRLPAPRSIHFFNQNLTIASPKDPRVVVIEDFLTKSECAKLRELADGKFERSKVTGPTNVDRARTSHTAHLHAVDDPVITAVRKKAAAVCDVPVDHIEPLQVVRYNPGQFYKAHYDYFTDSSVKKHGGQRSQTIFAYLNDLEGEAHTTFTRTGIKVEPKEGRAAWWYNLHTDGYPDANTMHEGRPPQKGTKYGLNIFVRQTPYT